MELLKLQKYNEHRQETGETLAPTGPPTWWNMAAIPAFRCGIGILFARLWSPLIWIFLVPLVSSHLAPAQAHNPFDTITNGQPTRQLSSTVPNTSSAGSKSKEGSRQARTRADGPAGQGGGIDLYSLEKERELGRQLARDVEAQSQLIGESMIDECENRWGQRIVLNSAHRCPLRSK